MKKKLYGIGILLGMAAMLVWNTQASATEIFEAPVFAADVEEELDACYGTYRIVKYCPWGSIYGGEFNQRIRVQETDLLIGQTIDFQPEHLTVYSMGKRGFTNYNVERYVLESPQYICSGISPEAYVDPDETIIEMALGEGYFGQWMGNVTVYPDEVFSNAYYIFYVFQDKNKMVVDSNAMGGIFLLERCEEEQKEPFPEWSGQGNQELLQAVYGDYRVAEFLPTKYYPAWDQAFPSGEKMEESVLILPEEEADMMIGKTITISEDLFAAYDNFRKLSYAATDRLADDFWVEKVEIENPEYQVSRMWADEIYGIRDNMLPGELVQSAYVEVEVYPGYETSGKWNLPRMYLTNDGRILLYAMGEYFLLERTGGGDNAYQDLKNEPPGIDLTVWIGRRDIRPPEIDLTAWIGRKTMGGLNDASAWVGRYTYWDVCKKYELDIREEGKGEYVADIEIETAGREETTKIKADVEPVGNELRIIFRECLTGEPRWESRESDMLLKFREDTDTGDIYTYWGELNGGFDYLFEYDDLGEVCFVKEQE